MRVETKYIKTIDSTNDELKRLAESGLTDDFILVSDEQTKGKGRRGRSFYSPCDTGIYLSFLLHPNITVEDAQDLTTMMAAAASVAIENVSGYDVSIKWVNDLMMRGKKISGILTESSPVIKNDIPEYVIVGIGINVFEPEGGFSAELKNIAGAVFMDENIPCDDAGKDNVRHAIAEEVIKQFKKYYEAEFAEEANFTNMDDVADKADFTAKAYLSEYKKRLSVIGKDIDLLSPDHTPLNKKARVLGINNKCHLHVKYEDGTEEYLSNGEISLSSGHFLI